MAKKKSHVGGWVGREIEVKKQKRYNEEKRNVVQRRRKKQNRKGKEKKGEEEYQPTYYRPFFEELAGGRVPWSPCSSVLDCFQ